MDKRFEKKKHHNQFFDLTNNTIVLCSNWELMQSFADEIIKTVNGEAEYNDYVCDDEDVGSAKVLFRFGLQCVIGIREQRFTLALEPAIVYKATDIKDIWFLECWGSDRFPPYRECIYPMTVFKGSHDLWNSGKDEVYKMICDGRYGGYYGDWINLHPDDCKKKDCDVYNCSVMFNQQAYVN